jgi:hypothetical protein
MQHEPPRYWVARGLARLLVVATLATLLSGCIGRRQSRGILIRLAAVLIEVSVKTIAEAGRSRHGVRESARPEPSPAYVSPPARAESGRTHRPLPRPAPVQPPIAAAQPSMAPSTMPVPQTTEPVARFDVGAARRALSEATVSACRDEGVPRGYLRVSAQFTSDGTVGSVVVEEPRELSEEAHACVADALRGTRIPTFGGDAVTVGATWFVP